MQVKVAKLLLVLRHTLKGGPGENDQELSGELIGPNGRKAIKQTELPRELTENALDLFHTGLIRTAQCCITFAVSNGIVGHVHDPLLNLGNQDLFDSWMDQGLKEKMEEQSTGAKALLHTLGTAEWNRVCADCGADIKAAFDRMIEKHGLVICHTPTAEAAAAHFGFHYMDKQLKENEGFIFVQDNDGQIFSLDLWQPGDELKNIEIE